MYESQCATEVLVLQPDLRNQLTKEADRVVESTWKTEMGEQRFEHRLTCIPTRGIACAGEGSEPADAEIQDVSSFGLHLVLDRPIALGSAVTVELTGMVVAGEIRYCRPNGATSFDAGLKIDSAQKRDHSPAPGRLVEYRKTGAVSQEQLLRRARFVLVGTALVSLVLFLRRPD